MLNLAKKLREKGVEIFFIAAQLGELPSYDKYQGFDIHRVKLYGDGGSVLAQLSYWVSLTIKLFQKRAEYDIVVSNELSLSNIIIGGIGKVLNKRTIGRTSLEGECDFRKTGRIFGAIQAFFFRFIDAYIAISSTMYSSLEKTLGTKQEKLNLIPNGVCTRKFRPVSEKEKLSLKDKMGIVAENVILYVGIIDSRKGVDTLVKAWIEHREEVPNTTLLLVGPLYEKATPQWSDSFYRFIKSQVESVKDSSIKLLGKKNNIAEYMKVADAFVLPSQAEGMPNVILEAMSSGLPIISTNIGGSRDLVRHGQNGYLFNVGDSEELGKLMGKIIQEKDNRKNLAKESRKIIEEFYSMDIIAEKYFKLFKSL